MTAARSRELLLLISGHQTWAGKLHDFSGTSQNICQNTVLREKILKIGSAVSKGYIVFIEIMRKMKVNLEFYNIV